MSNSGDSNEPIRTLQDLTWPQLYAALDAQTPGAETELTIRMVCGELGIADRRLVTPSWAGGISGARKDYTRGKVL